MFKSDLHTHTIISGHAYSTLTENINHCKTNGIEILGTSEHAPTMPGAPHAWYFGNMKILPRYINDVLILRGCEVNILNPIGDIDLSEEQYKYLDYMIASLHEPIFSPTYNKLETTSAILNALNRHKKIEILGHLGNPNYSINYEAIVEEAKKKNIMIEINSSSLSGSSRVGSYDNCKKIASLCKEIGTKVILNSDAHYHDYIGKFDKGIELLKSIDMPESLIMNEPKKLIAHLKSKGSLSDI